MVFLVNKRMGTVAARTLATRVYPFSVDIQKNSNTSRIRKKIRLESIRFHSTHKGLSLVVLAAVVSCLLCELLSLHVIALLTTNPLFSPHSKDLLHVSTKVSCAKAWKAVRNEFISRRAMK